jgi:hypothetical protein
MAAGALTDVNYNADICALNNDSHQFAGGRLNFNPFVDFRGC